MYKRQDYSQVYEALTATKRKIPARVLRFFKEQMYELVHTPGDNAGKLAVVDFDQINSADKIEFVVGIGVAQRHQEIDEKVQQHMQESLAKKGYAGVSPSEIFTDVLSTDSRFDSADLLSAAYPGLARSNRTFIPVFRYLRGAGINTPQELAASKYEGAKKVVAKLPTTDYSLSRSYAARYRTAFADLSTAKIIDKATGPSEACIMLGFQPSAAVDVPQLRNFLLEHAGAFTVAPYVTCLLYTSPSPRD